MAGAPSRACVAAGAAAIACAAAPIPARLCGLASILSWNLCSLACGVCWAPGLLSMLSDVAQWAISRLLRAAPAAFSPDPGACRVRPGWAALLPAAVTPPLLLLLAISCMWWRRRMQLQALDACTGRTGSGKGECTSSSTNDPSRSTADVAARLPRADQSAAGRAPAALQPTAGAAPPDAKLTASSPAAASLAAVHARLLDAMRTQQAAAARRRLGKASSLYTSRLTHATALAKLASADGPAGKAQAAAGRDLATAAVAACRGALLAASACPPLQVRCVVFPGCVSVAAQAVWQAGADVPSHQAFWAALQEQLGEEAGAQLLAAALEQGQGQAAVTFGGCWCPTPVLAFGADGGLQVQLVLPQELLASLVSEGVNVRIVVSCPSAAGAGGASEPLADVTLPPQELLPVQLPACSGPLVTVLLLRTTAAAEDSERPSQPELDSGEAHSQEQLLASLPLLVLPSEAAAAEGMSLWSTMVAQWRDAHPVQPLDQASPCTLLARAPPLPRCWCCRARRPLRRG
jgi:hypothetical protein